VILGVVVSTVASLLGVSRELRQFVATIFKATAIASKRQPGSESTNERFDRAF
jgi:hypothetical protein